MATKHYHRHTRRRNRCKCCGRYFDAVRETATWCSPRCRKIAERITAKGPPFPERYCWAKPVHELQQLGNVKADGTVTAHNVGAPGSCWKCGGTGHECARCGAVLVDVCKCPGGGNWIDCADCEGSGLEKPPAIAAAPTVVPAAKQWCGECLVEHEDLGPWCEPCGLHHDGEPCPLAAVETVPDWVKVGARVTCSNFHDARGGTIICVRRQDGEIVGDVTVQWDKDAGQKKALITKTRPRALIREDSQQAEAPALASAEAPPASTVDPAIADAAGSKVCTAAQGFALRDFMLTHVEGAEARWKKRRKSGMDDAQLREGICAELGIHGYSSGHFGIGVGFRAKPRPAVWFDSFPEGKPHLAGKQLVDLVRELLKIPRPDEVRQKRSAKNKPQKPQPLPGDWKKAEAAGLKGDLAQAYAEGRAEEREVEKKVRARAKKAARRAHP